MSSNKDFVIENGVLKKYTGSDSVVVIPEGVTVIGDYTFDGCSSLTSINIPDGVTSIGDYAFWNCTSLTSITIPDGVTSIGDEAFYSCSSLTSITIPNSVTSIGDSAFGFCGSLTSITIPNSVTSINNQAFWECTNLSSATIGSGVVTIGEDVFRGSGLKDVYYKGTEQQWDNIKWESQGFLKSYLPNVRIHFNCKYSNDLSEIEKEVRKLLSEGKSEAEIYKTLKAKGNTSDNDIVNALSKVNFNSPMVLSFCDKVILPDITSLLGKGRGESKYTVGEVAEIMYKKHPKPLVDSAIVKVLYNEYLVD